MKKWRLPLYILICVACLAAFAAAGLADAGNFGGDSDWGGSDWSGSDWGGSDWGGSDWGDSGWDDSFGVPVFLLSGGGGSIVSVLVVALVIFLFVRSRSRRIERGRRGAQPVQHAPAQPAGLPLSALQQKDPAFSEQALLEHVRNLYVQMQHAWEQKDWEPMRAFLTDALYSQMARQLDELKEQGLTNHVDRIAVLDAFISRYCQEGDDDVLIVRLSTRICDYTVRDDTGELVRGSRTRELFMTYDWKLSRSASVRTDEGGGMRSVSCPNCGAPLSVRESGRCEYCGTVVTLSEHDWALAAITGVSQRSEG